MENPYGSEPVPETHGRLIRWASFYDRLTAVLFLGKEGAVREATVGLANIQKGDRVLDVGCGTGTLTRVAKRRAGEGGEVCGIDAAPEMIDVATQKAREAGVEIEYHVGIIEDLPFPNGSFDVVLSSLMLHHLPPDVKEAGFRELLRLLKPGGRFLAVDLTIPRFSIFDRVREHLHGHASTTRQTRPNEDMMRDAGFVNIETEKMGFAVLEYYRGTSPS